MRQAIGPNQETGSVSDQDVWEILPPDREREPSASVKLRPASFP